MISREMAAHLLLGSLFRAALVLATRKAISEKRRHDTKEHQSTYPTAMFARYKRWGQRAACSAERVEKGKEAISKKSR